MNAHDYKQKLLNDLYAPFAQCHACPLGFQGRTNVVFGTGNPDAQLMFIGEAPGRDEDAQGKPFMGRSGQLLNKIFEAIGLKREDVYITNIVKCRPPGNRRPVAQEMSTCKKLLLINQLKIIRPKVLCTLGSAALEGLLGRPVKITQERGVFIEYEHIPLLPTYHPAYILRNQKELETLFLDIQKAYLTCK